MKSCKRTARSMLWLAPLGLVILAGVLGACASKPMFNGQAVDAPGEAPEVAGLNWDGRPFRLSDHRGKVAVLSFGYTFCPDVCPFTLWKMKDVFARLGETASEVAFVFISVDPKRDTPEKIAEYVSAFDPRFYGVYLEGEGLDSVTGAYEVSVRQVPFQNAANLDGSYHVDHTGTYFVVDRRGRLRLHLPPNTTAEDIVPDLLTLIEEG